MEQEINLFDDFENQFEVGKEYQVILTDAKTGVSNNGKNFISHVMIGMKGEKFTNDFYIDSDGGRAFYTRFLSSCGVPREDTKKWRPSQLDGRFVNVSFFNQEYQKQLFDEYGVEAETETMLSFKIKNFRRSTATPEIMAALEKIIEDRKTDGDGLPF